MNEISAFEHYKAVILIVTRRAITYPHISLSQCVQDDRDINQMPLTHLPINHSM